MSSSTGCSIDSAVLVVNHRNHFPGLKEELDDFRQYLLDETREMPELKAWQLQGGVRVPLSWLTGCQRSLYHLIDLGLQAAQRIMSSDDPLRTMQDISQNVPILAK